MINDRIKQRELDRSKNSTAPAGVMPIHSQRKRKAFLDILLDEYDKGNIPIEGVREEVDTFMFEVDLRHFCMFLFHSKFKNLLFLIEKPYIVKMNAHYNFMHPKIIPIKLHQNPNILYTG